MFPSSIHCFSHGTSCSLDLSSWSKLPSNSMCPCKAMPCLARYWIQWSWHINSWLWAAWSFHFLFVQLGMCMWPPIGGVTVLRGLSPRSWNIGGAQPPGSYAHGCLHVTITGSSQDKNICLWSGTLRNVNSKTGLTHPCPNVDIITPPPGNKKKSPSPSGHTLLRGTSTLRTISIATPDNFWNSHNEKVQLHKAFNNFFWGGSCSLLRPQKKLV